MAVYFQAANQQHFQLGIELSATPSQSVAPSAAPPVSFTGLLSQGVRASAERKRLEADFVQLHLAGVSNVPLQLD